MAESTGTFGNTRCLNDIDGGAVTLPPCAASVPILADQNKSIEKQPKTSSGVIEDPETDASGLTTLFTSGMGDICTQVEVRSLIEHFHAHDPHVQTLRLTKVIKNHTASTKVQAAAVVKG